MFEKVLNLSIEALIFDREYRPRGPKNYFVEDGVN